MLRINQQYEALSVLEGENLAFYTYLLLLFLVRYFTLVLMNELFVLPGRPKEFLFKANTLGIMFPAV
jgi:hypothetical protein